LTINDEIDGGKHDSVLPSDKTERLDIFGWNLLLQATYWKILQPYKLLLRPVHTR
jgi:hypothetical protein